MPNGPTVDAFLAAEQQETDRKQFKKEIDTVIENLSLCCEILEGQLLLYRLPKSLQAWWLSHKKSRENDRKRYLAEQARAKLTAEECEALGLK